MKGSWSFITNHALILVYVIRNRDSTVREISAGIGVTERAALAILRELDEEGIVERHRDGRRNTYSVNFQLLARYRRDGVESQTPLLFVNALVRVLVGMSGEPEVEMPSEQHELHRRTGGWGFFSNHLQLLLAIAANPSATVRELSARAGLTERAVVTILKQLGEAAILHRERSGRRNTYEIDLEAFRDFPRWSPGTWEFPPELVGMASEGLRRMMAVAPPAGEAAPTTRERVTV